MKKNLGLKLVLFIGFMILFLFIPQNVVWSGLDPQTVPTLPPTATSTSTVTATSTVTVTPTMTNTNTSVPPTITRTFTATTIAQASATFTSTPEVIVPPPSSPWRTFVLLGLLAAVALSIGIIVFFLIFRRKKAST